MSSGKSQLSNAKLLCSHLLGRAGLKSEVLMFASSMKKGLKRRSSYVRTFYDAQALQGSALTFASSMKNKLYKVKLLCSHLL